MANVIYKSLRHNHMWGENWERQRIESMKWMEI